MARSHYRGTVYGNLTTGAKPLPGAAIRLYHPDTGQPWALPVYPDPVNGVPYTLPILTNPVGELELWADEPARVACTVSHPRYHGAGEIIEIRLDPGETATDTDVVESVADHEAKEDPHDQYLTEPEGNLLYKPLGYEPDLTDYYTKGEADDEFLDQDEADLRYEQLSRKGMPSGYAPLDFAGVIPPVYLPPLAITETWVVISEAEMLALPAQQGDVAVRLDTTENYILRVDPATVLENWTKLAASTTAGNTSVLRREEFTPAPLTTTVTLAAPPTTVHAVSRNGVGQSQPAGHYSLSGLVLTFSDPFELGERVAVVYEIGSTVPAPVNGYTKEESDLRYEPIDTMYTKGESDAKYLTQALGDARYSLIHTHPYLPLAGGDLTGPLTIQTKPVNVSPDSGNALVWRSNGFYSSGSGGNVTVVNREEFFPAAAATTVTLAQAPSEILSVSRNGVEQFASAGDYSVAGAVVTFTSAFVAGERVSVLSEVGTSVPVDAYTTAQADARFLQLTGGNLSGALTFGTAPSGDTTLQRVYPGSLQLTGTRGRLYARATSATTFARFGMEYAGSGAVFSDNIRTDEAFSGSGWGKDDTTKGAWAQSMNDGYWTVTHSKPAANPAVLLTRFQMAPTGTLSLTADAAQPTLITNGNVGVGITPGALNSSYRMLRIGATGTVQGHVSVVGGFSICDNALYTEATTNVAVVAGAAVVMQVNSGADALHILTAPSVAAGANLSFTSRFKVNQDGYVTTNPVIGYADWVGDRGHIVMVGTGSARKMVFNFTAGAFHPDPDNSIAWGNPSYRFTSVYATSGVVSTSSLKYKDPQGDLDPELALRAVLRTPARRFRYKGTERTQAGYYLEEADPLFTIGPDEASPSNDTGILMAALQAICARLGISI